MTRPIVVGVDFSPSSDAAVAYGADLAARHDAPLHLIHAYQSPLYAYSGIGVAGGYTDGEDQVSDYLDRQLKQTAENLHYDHLRLPHIDVRRVDGNPASVLIDASRDATATVVGCRGIGGFTELLLGSVCSQLAAHGHGPVIVIRPPVGDHAIASGPEQPRHVGPIGPVLVGVDGSPASQAALEFAATEAHARRTELIAVHVYWVSPWTDTDSQDHALVEAEQLVAQALSAAKERYPGLATVGRTMLHPNTEQALTEASGEAALIVVGCRGRGGFAGMLLGSVSRTLVHHAFHPVAVIHPVEHS